MMTNEGASDNEDEGASDDEGREVGAFEETVCLCLVAQHLLKYSVSFVYRGYSRIRTHSAPRVVLFFKAYPYCRTLGRCVSLFASNPCILAKHFPPIFPFVHNV